jgi:hypothetical protein
MLLLLMRPGLQGMLESDDEDTDEQNGMDDKEGWSRLRKSAKKTKSIDSIALEEQKGTWLLAKTGEKPKGVALCCLLCKRKLLINAGTLRTHTPRLFSPGLSPG